MPRRPAHAPLPPRSRGRGVRARARVVAMLLTGMLAWGAPNCEISVFQMNEDDAGAEVTLLNALDIRAGIAQLHDVDLCVLLEQHVVGRLPADAVVVQPVVPLKRL